MNQKYLNRIIFILALIGICIASYVSYTWLSGSPIVCISGGCETVRKNPAAWPFGIPFPILGLAGYAFIAIMAFLRTTCSKYEKFLGKIIFGFACFGIGLVTYFTLLEALVIKGFCMWCIFSTIDMYLIFFISLKSLILKKT